ncbi:MAG TPA: cellulose-binding protein [Candidatus Dormibacteraeota bacterium]|nr:cellulose-binding protein [Candidatus Dormibacteraeota bacterium]
MRETLAAALAMLALTAMPARAAAGPQLGTAQVSVQPQRVLARMPETGIGANTAAWDGHMLDPSLPGLLRKAGVRMLRFPGGSTADLYHWRTNSLIAGHGRTDPRDTFPAFLGMARRTGAQALITVNYGSGSPEEAAAWVRQADRIDPSGVRYWEVGNEVYGDGAYGSAWEYDDHVAKGPVAYAENLLAYARAMKAVDPDIEIGADLIAPGAWPDGIVLPGQTLDWNRTVLSIAGGAIDFVTIHWYPEDPKQPSDAALLGAPRTIPAAMATLRWEIAQYCGDRAVQVVVSETDSVPTSPGSQTVSPVSPLFLADDYASWLSVGALSVDWWDVHNGVTPDARQDADDGGGPGYGSYGFLADGSCVRSTCEPRAETPLPAYRGLLMVARWIAPGDYLVAAGSDRADLVVHAAMSESGAISLLLINENASEALRVSLPSGLDGMALRMDTYGQGGGGIGVDRVRGPTVRVAPYSLALITLDT